MSVGYLLNILDKSGLSVVEFTELLPIDRTTWYGWVNGKTPDPLRLRLSVARAKHLEALIDAGSLPMAEFVRRRDRRDILHSMLQKRQKTNG